MFLKGFGEVLTDVMTVNPSLGSLPTASSILDASNYTFQAVTFGKDAQGFQGLHSHLIQNTGLNQYVNGNPASGVSSYDLGVLAIVNRGGHITGGASSYVVQSTYELFSSTYHSVPNYPSIEDTRLERGSTKDFYLSAYHLASALPDLGHYPNSAVDPSLSSISNKVGGFAPSGGISYAFYNGASLLFVGNLSGSYNTSGLMDKDGFLTINPKSVVNASITNQESAYGAVLVSGSPSINASGGNLKLAVVVHAPDAGTLAAYGGVKHMGVYCLDMKEMLKEGLLPPYEWDALNNIRKYKLVSKSTFLDNPLYHRDYLGSISGFKILSENGAVVLGVPVSAFTNDGPTISLVFSFT